VGEVETQLKEMLPGICQEIGVNILALEIMPDHVHIFLNALPSSSPADIMAKVKASQYNHATDCFVKKELGERWNSIDGIEIQRDLYSSFLIMNVNPDLNSVNRGKCVATYPNFVRLHDLEIQRIKTGPNKKLAGMGL